MSPEMRAYLIIVSATVVIPWLLTELTVALGIGVKR